MPCLVEKQSLSMPWKQGNNSVACERYVWFLGHAFISKSIWRLLLKNVTINENIFLESLGLGGKRCMKNIFRVPCGISLAFYVSWLVLR